MSGKAKLEGRNLKRSHFNIPEEVSYLNCAYMSPLSKEVLAAGEKALYRKALPYEIVNNDFFEPVDQLKNKFAQLIGLENYQRIAVMPSASYGFATIAKNVGVKPGQNIVILSEQFPSNVYCWQRLCQELSAELRVVQPDELERGASWSERILESIDENTAALSMGMVHWTDGTTFNLSALRKRTHEVGAKLILDGTQAIGALPFSLETIKPDAMVCAAYKWLMGPYGITLAYFGPEFDGGVPIEESWINRIGSDDFQAQVGYQQEYLPYATRYDMGEKSNFTLLPMLTTAITQILSWGVENIQDHCRQLGKSELLHLQNAGFNIESPAHRAHHIFGIKPPKGFNYQLVREALKKKKVSISFRGKNIRVSPHIYNTEEDFEKLREGLTMGLT